MGLLLDINWAVETGLDNVIFELDSKLVVDSVTKPSLDHSEYGAIIQDVINILATKPNFKVEFVKHQANLVAHKIVRAAICYAGCHIFSCIPSCVDSLEMQQVYLCQKKPFNIVMILIRQKHKHIGLCMK